MEKAQLIEIIQKSKDGDMEAMEKLLLHAHTSVSYQCRKMIKNEQDAEDMTQEILVTVYQKLDTLKEPAAFYQWLKRITATRCINTLTRTHVELQFAEDEEGHSILDTLEEMDERKVPDKWMDNRETTRMIAEIVDGLPEAQRLCTLMFYYSEMSVKEMANTLNVPENTVKSRLNYARKAIKEKVQEYEKQGIKLYGMSPLPFLFYFLHKCEDTAKSPADAQIMVDEILAEQAGASGLLGAATSASGSTGSAVAAIGTAAAASTGSTVGAAGIAVVLGGMHTKMIAGIAALLLVAGATSAVVLNDSGSDKFAETPVILSEVQENGPDNSDFAIADPTTPSEETSEEEEIVDVPTDTPTDDIPAETNENEDSASDPGSAQDPGATEGPEADDTTNVDLTAHTHDYVADYTVAPCCMSGGYTSYVCTICIHRYDGDFTSKLQHVYKKTVVPPTVYSQGYTIYECIAKCGHSYHTVCGHTYMTDYTDKLPSGEDTSGCTHAFNAVTVREATCQSEGLRKFTCEHCNLSYTEPIPTYANHKWGRSATFPPDCQTEGYELYFCAYCSAEQHRNIVPALGHDYSATVISPTATAQGYTLFTCNHCGKNFKDNYTEVTGGSESMHTHSYTSETTEATCWEGGIIKYTCACGHVYFEELGIRSHSLESTVVPPTESSSGYTEHTCTLCGHSYRDSYTEPIGQTP